MATELHIDEVRGLLMAAKERIAGEREAILAAHSLSADCSRDEYAFAYMQAERMGMRAIRHQLDELAWLPTRLDPDGEVGGAGDGNTAVREQMRAWITRGRNNEDGQHGIAPDAMIFGNDFIHALTRCGLATGPAKTRMRAMATRIGTLFHDLSLLVSSLHCCNTLREFNIDYIELSDPQDQVSIAQELAMVADYLVSEAEALVEQQKAETRAAQKKSVPHLRLVKSDVDFSGDYAPAH
ncbi:MAG: hypothetical protein GC131_02860 [Alphaproteobacteria bacterium]|nr:hypothetical protein [Alphaproteobacteria bacterium]